MACRACPIFGIGPANDGLALVRKPLEVESACSGSFYSLGMVIIRGMDTMDTLEAGRSLQAAFAAVPAILTLAVCAMLSGARSLCAIHQRGRCQDRATVAALGHPPQTPAVSCLHRVFRGLDAAAFEEAAAKWSRRYMAPDAGGGRPLRWTAKPLRGIHGEELPGVRLVAGYTHGSGLTVGQKGGQARMRGTAAARQLTAELLPVAGNLITGDSDYRGCAIPPAGLLPTGAGGWVRQRLSGHRQKEPAGTVRGHRPGLCEAGLGAKCRKARQQGRHGDRRERRQLRAAESRSH